MGRCAKECFRFLPLPEFKQAFPETDSRIIQRLDSQRAAVEIRSPSVVAVPYHRRRKSQQSVVMHRLRRVDLSKHRLRPDTLVAFRQNISQGKLQIGRLWLERQPALGDSHRLVKLSGLAQLECEFDKRRKVGRPPGDGAPQLIQRFVSAIDSGEHARKQSFDRWLAGPARKFRQVHDGLVEAILRQKGAPKDLCGERVATVGLQDLRRELLCFLKLLHLQRQQRLCERGRGWPVSFRGKAL